jgi:hypothetical protein
MGPFGARAKSSMALATNPLHRRTVQVASIRDAIMLLVAIVDYPAYLNGG